MASAKDQTLESKMDNKFSDSLELQQKKDGKMKVLPDIFMKTSEIQNGPWSNSLPGRDVQEK